jgi:hypothetical protein
VHGERQGEEPVGDGAAERALFGALGVDVDPLVVAGDLGEAVDALLIHGQPVGDAELLSEQALQLLGRGDDSGAHQETRSKMAARP